MKISPTYEILDHLATCSRMMIDAIFSPYYAKSKLARQVLGLDQKCRHRFFQEKRPLIATLLSRLSRQGLVVKSGSRRNFRWHITNKGKLRLAKKEIRNFSHELPAPDGRVRLVTFDIPEQLRKKRDWLRTQLVGYDFKQLHKSVWISMRPLSQEFIQSIDDMQLSKYVHIISVDNKGTLV